MARSRAPPGRCPARGRPGARRANTAGRGRATRHRARTAHGPGGVARPSGVPGRSRRRLLSLEHPQLAQCRRGRLVAGWAHRRDPARHRPGPFRTTRGPPTADRRRRRAPTRPGQAHVRVRPRRFAGQGCRRRTARCAARSAPTQMSEAVPGPGRAAQGPPGATLQQRAPIGQRPQPAGPQPSPRLLRVTDCGQGPGRPRARRARHRRTDDVHAGEGPRGSAARPPRATSAPRPPPP